MTGDSEADAKTETGRRRALPPGLSDALSAFAVSRALIVVIGLGAVMIRESATLGINIFSSKTWGALGEAFTLWDGQWYLAAVTRGYGPAGVNPDGQSTWPFFPLLPGLMRALEWLGIPPAAGGVLVANAAFLVALWLLWRVADDRGGEVMARRAVWMAALVPFGVSFSMIYPDGIFMAASCGGFLAVARKRYVVAGLAVLVAALARPNGVLLAVPLAYLIWREETGGIARLKSLAPLALGPLAVAGWAVLLGRWAGDPLAFASGKAAWRELPIWEVPGAIWDLIGGGGGNPLSGGAIVHLAVAAAGLSALWFGRKALARGWLLYCVLVIGAPLALGVVGLARYTSSLFPVYIAAAGAVPTGGRLERWLVFAAGLLMAVTVTGVFWSRLVP